MKLARDKKLHVIMCACIALFVVALDWIARAYGLPAAMFVGGSAAAWAYEGIQKYRGDGEPSWQDAAAGMVGAAIVSLVAAVLMPL
jgi:hypothetical protein